MNLKFLIAGWLCATSIKALGIGNDMGNGGDLVNCKPAPNLSIDGYYSLDYLLTYDANYPLASAKDYRTSMKNIEKVLARHIPELHLGFSEFRKYLFNENPSGPRVWRKAPFGVIEVNDEDIPSVHRVPDNCRNQKGKIDLVQAIVRLKKDFSGNKEKTFYSFMPKILDSTNLKNPIQVSFILVHEWLWDHSKNVQRNRQINRFLHSEEIYNMSRSQVRKRFLDLGFVLPARGMEVFYDNWCKSDKDALNRLKAKKPWIIDRYGFVERRRTCGDISGCTDWRISENTKHHGAISLILQKNKVKIYPKGTPRRKPKNTCKVDENGQLNCGNWFNNRKLSPRETNGPFIGELSDSCLQVTQLNKKEHLSWGSKENLVYHTEVAVFATMRD